MAFGPRLQRLEELVTPKQRETLAAKKAEYTREMNDQLNQLSDSWYKQKLIERRDHCLSKFPISPVDLSIWIVAYYEDWVKELREIPESERQDPAPEHPSDQ